MMKMPGLIGCSADSHALMLAALLLVSQTQSAPPVPAPATGPAASQPQQPAPSSDDVPVTGGSSGPCSVEFTVTDSDGKPIYAARIDVHLAYGAFGAHKLDMGVYTNAAGKARFTGIPAKVKKPPVEYRAKKDDLVGLATVDPATECQARHDIVMAKSSH